MLALMMFLAPALGVPAELMLQDTLKSIVVAFGALVAALCCSCWCSARRASRCAGTAWCGCRCCCGLCAGQHGLVAHLPGRGGGGALVRLRLLAWLGLNTLTRERLDWLAWGVHAGAVVASLWAALQFWVGFGLFPQGPNPGSTFINRNFFAEFVVCTLPFGALLLARARARRRVALLRPASAW